MVRPRLGVAELRELNRIGVNLNQMAPALNSGAVSAPSGTREAVKQVGEPVLPPWGVASWSAFTGPSRPERASH